MSVTEIGRVTSSTGGFDALAAFLSQRASAERCPVDHGADVSAIRSAAFRRAMRPAGFLSILLFVTCADDTRVGVVDVQEAFQRSPLVMVSAHRIEDDLGGAVQKLKERGRALAEMRMQLEHGGVELDEEQRAQAEARIAEETAGLLEAQRRYRVDLAAAQRRRGAELIARVEEVAREVAREEGLPLLLLEEGALYTEEGALYEGALREAERVDLTERVARALLERINPTEIPET
ncbi:MAG: OmpH family outer membrane protein [Myxococcota bacterium]